MEEKNFQEKTKKKTMTMRELDNAILDHEIQSIMRRAEAKKKDFTIGGFVTACIVILSPVISKRPVPVHYHHIITNV